MIQKHRISTDIGRDKKIVVELKQDFDLLEVLSLKFTQKDIYTSLCSDYGVVCGRISVNDGLGVPNARVSIFIPLTEDDESDPVISELYPYKNINDVSEDGYRYNLLPSRKQHGGHQPTGTFPDQSDILTREEYMEVYEKYYKYTVKTNDAGDFMIWGVPLGEQTIHVDVDLSDIGCFSLRPYDFIKQGDGEDKFKNTYEFKSSSDLNSLPQIKTFKKNIDVYPFWGNEELCEIGITRTDFDLSEVGVKIEPKAFLIGGTFTDKPNMGGVNKNCQIRPNSGKKCELQTKSGKIEGIRFTNERDTNNRPILERYEIDEDIPEDGSFVIQLPMNMEYVYTNEFGELEVTNDSNKGVPTAACYRFRFSLDDAGRDRRRQVGRYLVPNIRHYRSRFYTKPDGSLGLYGPDESYAFSTNWDNYPYPALSENAEKGIFYNVDGKFHPRDYFYRFTYNKVYTISSFHSMYYRTKNFTGSKYIGIKEIVPDDDCSEILTPPTNFGVMSFNFKILLALFLMILESVGLTIQLFIINSFSRILFRLGIELDDWPTKGLGIAIKKYAYRFQEENQKSFALMTYPECESCDEDNVNSEVPTTNVTYCSVGTVIINGRSPGATHEQYFTNAVSGTPINVVHNLGANPTIKVFVWNGTTYVQLVDYFYPNDPGTLNTFWVSGRTNNSNFDLYMNYLSPGINGYVRVEGSTSITFTTSTLNNTIPACIDPVRTPTGFTTSADLISKQNDYLLQSPLGNIITLSTTGTTYFTTDPTTGLLVLYDEGANISSTQTVTILDKRTAYSSTATIIEDGCDIYDTPYDEELITYYYTGASQSTRVKVLPANYISGLSVVATNLSNDNNAPIIDTGSDKCKCNLTIYSDKDEPGKEIYPLQDSFISKRGSDFYTKKTPSGQSEFRDGVFYFVPGAQLNKRVTKIVKEYIRRKRVAKVFCGGIVNYSFVDNWLSGSLYFYQFKQKKGKVCDDLIYVKNETNPDGQRITNYYYKSARFDDTTGVWGTTNWKGESKDTRLLNNPTTIVDLGPRDEFIKEICIDKSLDPNCSVVRSIGPSSFQDFGEILGMAINYRLDVSDNKFDYKDFFNNKGFNLPFQRILDGDLLQLISMNNEAGIEEFDLQNPKYLGYSYQVLDPDDPTFKPIFANNSGVYGPLPITLQLDDDGERVRACLNEPTHIDYSGNIVQGRLTESSQKVPFFLWEKKSTGFGSYSPTTHDDQSWDYTGYTVQPLQGMTYKWAYTGGTNDSSDQYLLLPMTYNFSGLTLTTGFDTGYDYEFDVVTTNVGDLTAYQEEYPGYSLLHVTGGTIDTPVSGNAYFRVGPVGYNTASPFTVTNGWAKLSWNNTKDFIIKPTLDYYSGTTKQILSTPFLFYFGLKAGKTGYDKFVKMFGDKGAFTSAE